MKKVLLLTAVLLLSLASFLMLVGCQKEQTPYEFLSDALEKTGESQSSDADLLLDQCLNGGSVDLSLTLADTLGLPINGVSMKVYANMKESQNAVVLSATNQAGKSLDASLFINQNDLIASSSNVEKAYGISMEQLTALINDAMSGVALPEGDGVSGATASSMAMMELLNQNSELSEKVIKLYDKAVEIFKQHAVATSVKENGLVVITIDLASAKTGAFICDYIEALQNDAECKAALEALFAAYLPDGSLDELFADYNRDEFMTMFTESPFSLKTVFTATTKKVIKTVSIQATYEDNADSFSFTMDIEEDGGLVVNVTDPDNQTYRVAWDVENTDKTYKGKLNITVTAVTLTPIEFEYNKESGAYTLKAQVPGTFSATLSGSFTSDATQMSLRADSITLALADEEGTFGPAQDLGISLALTLKAADTMPTAPTSYQDVTALSEEDAMAILTELSENEIFASLMMLFSGTENEG